MRPITDEAAYTKALPDAQKLIKDNGGLYVAGGFNKAKVNFGNPPVGNRYVIIRWENEAAFDKIWSGDGKDWVEKRPPVPGRCWWKAWKQPSRHLGGCCFSAAAFSVRG
jgi:hypothetical protein